MSRLGSAFSRPPGARAAGAFRSLLATLLCSAALACSGREAGPSVTVTDSAGVTLVANGPLSELPRYDTDPSPLLAIGVREGDPGHQLHRVVGGLVLADGGVVLLNAGTHELRWYDATGRLVRSWGREGDGPGELRGPERLFAYRGDSLGVWDDRHRRITLLDVQGTAGREITPAGDLARPTVVGALPDGGLVILDRRFDVPEVAEFQDFPGPTLLYDAEGAPTGDTLATDHWMTARMVSGEGFVQLHGRGLELPPGRATGPDALWVGDPRSGELRRHALDGTGVTAIARWPAGERGITEAVKSAYTESQLAAAPNEEVRQAIRRSAATQEYPERLPALASVDVASDGDVWVEAFGMPGSAAPPTWWIFDDEGRALRTVVLPPDAEPLWSDGERVLLRLRDELDVERIELRSIRPAEASSP